MEIDALFKITYGMYIATSRDGERISGFVGNTVMQVTDQPVRMALCSSKKNFTTELIRKSGKVAISVLGTGATQKMIGNFGFKSGRDFDKFAQADYFNSESGLPVVTENAIAWLEGVLSSEVDLGTHYLLIAEIQDGQILDPSTEAMTYDYYRKVLRGKAPVNAPTYNKSNNTNKKERIMENTIWVCDVCGYEYDPAQGDPDSGIAPGTQFEDIPDDWVCPICGVDKSNFSKKE